MGKKQEDEIMRRAACETSTRGDGGWKRGGERSGGRRRDCDATGEGVHPKMTGDLPERVEREERQRTDGGGEDKTQTSRAYSNSPAALLARL